MLTSGKMHRMPGLWINWSGIENDLIRHWDHFHQCLSLAWIHLSFIINQHLRTRHPHMTDNVSVIIKHRYSQYSTSTQPCFIVNWIEGGRKNNKNKLLTRSNSQKQCPQQSTSSTHHTIIVETTQQTFLNDALAQLSVCVSQRHRLAVRNPCPLNSQIVTSATSLYRSNDNSTCVRPINLHSNTHF